MKLNNRITMNVFNSLEINIRTIRLFPILLLTFFIFSSKNTFAQTDDNLNTQQVNIVTDFKPIISDAFKLNDNPTVRDTVTVKPMMTYNILKKQHKTTIVLDTIKAAKMKSEAFEKITYNYLKAGLGNYTTPYAEFFFGNLRSKQWQFGAHAKHLSSNYTSEKQGNAAYSDNIVDGFGKYIVNNHRITLNAGYTRNSNNIYSYNADLFGLNNYGNKYINGIVDVGAKVQSLNIDSTSFSHQIAINYYTLSRADSASKINSENHFSITADISKLVDKQNLGAELSFQHWQNAAKTSIIQTFAIVAPVKFDYLKFSPYVKAAGSSWSATLGASIFQEFNAKKTRFFPNIWFNYLAVPDFLTIYTSITGNANANTLRSLSADNPFLFQDYSNYKTTTTLLDATVGAKGNFNSKISYHVSGNYSIINQMQLFNEYMVFRNLPIGSTIDMQTFNPANHFHTFQFTSVYDNTKYWNVKASVGYKLNQKLETTLQATYQNFILDNTEYAWYKENVNVTLNAKYELNEKLSISLKAFYIGKRKGLSSQAAFSSYSGLENSYQGYFPIYNLPAYVDANLSTEYRHTKKLSAFLTLNNLLNARIQRWQHAPTMGFWLMGGITYSF